MQGVCQSKEQSDVASKQPVGRANEVSERRMVIVEGKQQFYIWLVLKGCPNLRPPLPHPLSMVQSDVKRFGICGYAIYYGNKLFE